MHSLIMVMVFAQDAESALHAAHEVVHEKLKTTYDGDPFDYYIDFTDDPRMDISKTSEEILAVALNDEGIPAKGGFGKDRWGPIPPVLQVSSKRFPVEDKRGLDLVNSAMESNRRSFKENMKIIRLFIAKYTDDQLFDEVEGKVCMDFEGRKIEYDLSQFRCFCELSCGLPGPDAFLYDFSGHAISRPKYLQGILNDSDIDPYYIDNSNGKDPNGGRHIWIQPLWVVPFDVHF